MFELFANSGDPDQMPCCALSDLGLHCLPVTFLGVSRLQWVNNVLNNWAQVMYLNTLYYGSKGKQCRPQSNCFFRYCLIGDYRSLHCLFRHVCEGFKS